MRKIASFLVLVGLLIAAPSFGASGAGERRARYSVPTKKLDEALNCRSLREDRFVQPLLLVHGTFADY